MTKAPESQECPHECHQATSQENGQRSLANLVKDPSKFLVRRQQLVLLRAIDKAETGCGHALWRWRVFCALVGVANNSMFPTKFQKTSKKPKKHSWGNFSCDHVPLLGAHGHLVYF
eukprot:scaffold4833_cov233-Amphora_coffeaeformis.AAC.4